MHASLIIPTFWIKQETKNLQPKNIAHFRELRDSNQFISLQRNVFSKLVKQEFCEN
jgi:hypothetical protein